jgi:hypothetical protein
VLTKYKGEKMIKEYTIEHPDGTKEYVVELTDKTDNICKLDWFLESLEFVREIEEFKTVQLQRYLQCGYGTVCKVLDALCALCAIEVVSGPPYTIYKSLLKG